MLGKPDGPSGSSLPSPEVRCGKKVALLRGFSQGGLICGARSRRTWSMAKCKTSITEPIVIGDYTAGAAAVLSMHVISVAH